MIQFFQTRIGQTFFGGTLPRLVKQLTRIADALEEGNGQPGAESTLATEPEPALTLEALQAIRTELLDEYYPPPNDSTPDWHGVTGAREGCEKFLQRCEEKLHVPF